LPRRPRAVATETRAPPRAPPPSRGCRSRPRPADRGSRRRRRASRVVLVDGGASSRGRAADRGCRGRGARRGPRPARARAQARSTGPPRAPRRAVRARAGRLCAHRVARRANDPSFEGGSVVRSRPRSAAADSCRLPRPTRASVRRAARRAVSRLHVDVVSRLRRAVRRAPATSLQRDAANRLLARPQRSGARRSLRSMTRRFVGIRWWLGAAFAVVAATSTAIVVSQFSSRSENAFRGHAEELAAGSAFLAAADISSADRGGLLRRRLPKVAQHFDLDLYVYGADGRLLAKAPARRTFAAAPAERAVALHVALTGKRRVLSTSNGGIVAIGVPLTGPSGAAIVALSRRP